VADQVHLGKDIYDGKYLEEAPDLVIDQAKGVHITGTIGRDSTFSDPEKAKWQAENKKYGLFAAHGPDFVKEGRHEISILDLAPTLLHLHDCRIPQDMDGEVRTEFFAQGTAPDKREPRFVETFSGAQNDFRPKATEQDVADRLSDLGYLE